MACYLDREFLEYCEIMQMAKWNFVVGNATLIM